MVLCYVDSSIVFVWWFCMSHEEVKIKVRWGWLTTATMMTLLAAMVPLYQVCTHAHRHPILTQFKFIA